MTRIFLSILAVTACLLACAKKPLITKSSEVVVGVGEVVSGGPVIKARRGPKPPVFADILFDFNSHVVAVPLKRIQLRLTLFPEAKLLLSGYADTVGGKDYNMRLSLKRALAVRDDLVAAGIPADRILTFAMGELAGEPALCRKVTIQIE